MPQTKAIVSIENVVASASINQTVDLNLITKNFVTVGGVTTLTSSLGSSSGSGTRKLRPSSSAQERWSARGRSQRSRPARQSKKW